MNHEQIEIYRKRLNTLTAECSDKKPEGRIEEELTKLAREVGASTCVLWVHPTSSSLETSNAYTPELIRNIHQALQTASMVNMCKTATEGHKMATETIRKACINSRIVAGIAFLSAAAAWLAVILN